MYTSIKSMAAQRCGGEYEHCVSVCLGIYLISVLLVYRCVRKKNPSDISSKHKE